MALHRLTAITIGVPHVDACRAFYRTFGLTEGAPGRFATAAGSEQLRLVEAERRGLVELGVGVEREADLDDIAARLARLDVVATREPGRLRATERAMGLTVVVEVAPPIVQTPEPAPAPNGPGRSTRVDARAPELAAPPARPRKLGHVVIGSPDAVGSRRFFTDGLGFAVSDELPEIQAAFLRCSRDHHNLLVQPAPRPFLHHTAWEVADVDEIGRGAKQVLAAHPEAHVWGLGRHALGSNFFWYLRDPAGSFVEYYSDLDVIADAAAWRARAGAGGDALAAWGPPVPQTFLVPDDLFA